MPRGKIQRSRQSNFFIKSHRGERQMKKIRILIVLLVALILGFGTTSVWGKAPLIGEVERSYALDAGNQEVRGLAFDDISKDAPLLYVLDAAGKIFVYGVSDGSIKGNDGLKLLRDFDLPRRKNGEPIESPRSLAFALENEHPILYFLNWAELDGEVKSELWRYDLSQKTSMVQNISLYVFRIGDRETLGLSYENGKILVSFDASGYLDHDLRVRRGIVALKWNQAYDKKLEFAKHLPDSGIETSRGLANMKFEGARYLWGTVGNKYIYAADADSGRAIFHFDMPQAAGKDKYWGLTFGDDDLWVAESAPGPDKVDRVNVTKNLDASYEGPRLLRHLIMTIQTIPERDNPHPGKVYHYYSRPYAHNQMPNQGVWPRTEKLEETSGAPNAAVKKFTYDPAGDTTSRQYMGLVEFADAPARTYSSRYEVDIWTNAYRKFVYPHRVNKDTKALAGMDYLADDPTLFNLTDKKTYDSFFKRVKAYILERYGVPADMDNPYWAARNALEYIQDHYYYPSRPKSKPAAVDYDHNHYDANPGNMKIDLSRKKYDKNQIIACSGTSVMLAGAMRYLGMPARWLGTGTEKGPKEWDKNGNGLLDEGEKAPVSSGHRYTQVWLGNHYGWICFDATPTRPPFNDYDPLPPMQPQWRFLNRVARGHLKEKRIVFNVGSKLFKPLYRDFEYDEKLAIDNNCGGDQRYNLQGRFDSPEFWKLARQHIFVKNVCFINDITVTGAKDRTKISWRLKGDWDKDPGARLSVYLEELNPETKKPVKISTLAKGIPAAAGNIQVDLSRFSGGAYRILIRKDGDAETGANSAAVNLGEK